MSVSDPPDQLGKVSSI